MAKYYVEENDTIGWKEVKEGQLVDYNGKCASIYNATGGVCDTTGVTISLGSIKLAESDGALREIPEKLFDIKEFPSIVQIQKNVMLMDGGDFPKKKEVPFGEYCLEMIENPINSTAFPWLIIKDYDNGKIGCTVLGWQNLAADGYIALS